jgi:hypothetical protein
MGGCWSNQRKTQYFSVFLETSPKPGGEKNRLKSDSLKLKRFPHGKIGQPGLKSRMEL